MNKAQVQGRTAPAKASKLGAATKTTQRTMGGATDDGPAHATAGSRAPVAHRSTTVKATSGAKSTAASAKDAASTARSADPKAKASANQDATPGRATVRGRPAPKATGRVGTSARQAAPSKAAAAKADVNKPASTKAAAAKKGSTQGKVAPAAKQSEAKRPRKPRPSRAGQRAAARKDAAAAAAQPASSKSADHGVAPADARPPQTIQAAEDAPTTNGSTLSSATLPEPAPVTDLQATDLHEAAEAPVDITEVVARAANDATEVGDVADLAHASGGEAEAQVEAASDAPADKAQPAAAAGTPDALEEAALIEAALAATMPPADVAGIDEEASLASVAAATPSAPEASAAAARPGAPSAPDGAGRTVRDDPSLDRRIIEGMLDDKDGFLDKMHRRGFGRDAVVRRAAELGLSEALIRQVKGVAADLAGERPGRRPTPGSLGARTCLSCDRVFFSSGPGNRLCTRCRGGDAGLAQL